MKKYLLASVAGVAAMAMSGAAMAEIVIATAGPMTGQYASFGAQMKLALNRLLLTSTQLAA